MVAIDSMFSGVQQVALSTGTITLTSPAGFTATPSPGPTQSQNRVLRFTGALTSDPAIVLPLPGSYIVENRTTGNFNIQLRSVSNNEAVSIPQGSTRTVYNDGSNVRFVDLGNPGDMVFLAGLNVIPTWVLFCTVQPYLLCDGTVYNFSQYPYLGARLLGAFGGNGTTTFAVPDLRGRYPLAYDGTGTRVTVAASGVNGQLLGSAQDWQDVVLSTAQIPSHFHGAGIFDPGHPHSSNAPATAFNFYGAGGNPAVNGGATATINANTTGVQVNSSNGFGNTYSAGGGQGHPNIPNTQVAGVWVVKT